MRRRRRFPGYRDPVGDAAAARVDEEREARQEPPVVRPQERSAWRSSADRDRVVAAAMAATFVLEAIEAPVCSHCGAEPVFVRRVRRFGREWRDLGRACREYLLTYRALPGERIVSLRQRRALPALEQTKVVRLPTPFAAEENEAA